ncbi:Fibrinogen-like protein A [Mytilus coruscus]|uniref:Fibrinogen-like protein A n=1 Tax=Mytilus coruscus TaxID=42192 RepID=A0A6J8DMZ8_MYTCO|nr:Fibrinogen-like protein A [Mytilus coruscus]
MLFCFGQLLLLLADVLIVSTEQCKSGIFHMNPDKLDTKLDGYNIRTFKNISPRGCFDKCIRRPRCHSYNYNRHVLRCKLNSKPKWVFADDFQSEVGSYVEIDHYRGDPMYDTCLGNPCKSGEICEHTKDGGVVCVKDQEVICEDVPADLKEELPEDCTKLRKRTCKTGVYTIYPSMSENGIDVLCNMANGGWTVIQRRIDGSENFRRTWVEYENGFGDLQKEFWLGNKYLNLLTSRGSYKLRVELVDTNGNMYYAEYHTFAVGDAASRYILTVNGYSETAGKSSHFLVNDCHKITNPMMKTYQENHDNDDGDDDYADIVDTLNVHFSYVAEKLIGNNTSDMDFSKLQTFTSKKLKETENFKLKLISVGEVYTTKTP